MQASIVIPVWNGSTVIADCLDSVYSHAGNHLLEVICVDNASPDESAALIVDRYPQVCLLRQPVNLGFAGGVNTGIEAAQGDVFVILNQDCVVHTGWLDALDKALQMHPRFGVVGCTVLNTDGTLNHTGARLRRPDAYGQHLTEIDGDQPRNAEFVTGAAVAIRRQTWETVGRFDEGFYPGYYEDIDYCYRARHQGIETAYVPQARITHLLSSREWWVDQIKHTANQHRARYRFVSKHFSSDEVRAFFEAESTALEVEPYFDQAIGRTLAARDTLRNLPDIVERRYIDLGDRLSPAHRQHLSVGFTQVLRRSLAVSEKLNQVGLGDPPAESWHDARQKLQEKLDTLLREGLSASQEWWEAHQKLQMLQARQLELLQRLHTGPASYSESLVKCWFQRFVRRPLDILTRREYGLLSEINDLHVARMDHAAYMHDLYLAETERALRLVVQLVPGDNASTRYHQDLTERRLKLLEILADYDYR